MSGAVGAALILASVLVAELAGRSHPAAVGAELVVLHVDDGPGTGQPPTP